MGNTYNAFEVGIYRLLRGEPMHEVGNVYRYFAETETTRNWLVNLVERIDPFGTEIHTSNNSGETRYVLQSVEVFTSILNAVKNIVTCEQYAKNGVVPTDIVEQFSFDDLLFAYGSNTKLTTSIIDQAKYVLTVLTEVNNKLKDLIKERKEYMHANPGNMVSIEIAYIK